MTCEWLTDHTKDLSRLQRRNAMIVRRVGFECIDGWMPLALIAWSRSGGSRRDELRAEMLTLYICDILRRLFCESVFPLVLKLRRDRAMYQAPTPPNQLGSRSVAARTQTAAEKQLQALEWQAAVEHEADECDAFDDYLEMMLQFSYLTLFSHVFPLAPLLSIIHNTIEQRSDLFKLCFVYRRTLPARARRLAAWEPLMKGVALMGVVAQALGLANRRLGWHGLS